LSDHDRELFVKTSIREVLRISSGYREEPVRDRLEEILAPLGWGIHGNEPHPIELQERAEKKFRVSPKLRMDEQAARSALTLGAS